jgi:carbonic anhydrase
MIRSIPITTYEDIPKEYRDTPIGLLLEYHNLNRPFDTYSNAQLLIGMCMDSRKHLHIPDNFAYIIRSGGGNLRYSEFKVSFAISVGGVRHIALLGHSQCRMEDLGSIKEQFIAGLVEGAGWERPAAEEHFMNFSPIFEIGEPQSFVLSEAKRLRLRYPNITIAPLFYSVEDNRISFLRED